jgi:hypothetical protein
MKLAMMHSFEVWILRFLQGAFFTGLIGCVLVVAISWVSVSRTGFGRGE